MKNYPPKLDETEWICDPTPAMPDQYKMASVEESYIAYYKGGKEKLLKWTNRHIPHVFL
jgi:hypothetical protein